MPAAPAKGRRGGRPTKLDDGVTRQIEQLVRAGLGVEIAAQAAGVARTTFYRWMQQGAKARPGAPTRELHDRVERARAESESILVTRVATAAGKGSWAAAAWLLERRFPERWMKPSERPLGKPDDDDRAPLEEDPFADVIDLAKRRRR